MRPELTGGNSIGSSFRGAAANSATDRAEEDDEMKSRREEGATQTVRQKRDPGAEGKLE